MKWIKKCERNLLKVLMYKSVIVSTSLGLLHGCRKFVELDPPTQSVVQSSVFTNDITATSVLTGIYTNMGKVSGGGDLTGSSGISVMTGLSSDELALHAGITNVRHSRYYVNELTAIGQDNVGSEHWKPLYNYIYQCNAAIEGLATSDAKNALTPAIHRQLQGEVYFMRAFFYFYLINLYGDVPLAITTDYKINGLLPRTEISSVYQQIISDLKISQELLSPNFLGVDLLSNSAERVRPTKWAATALLARTYLFVNDYSKAEEEASKLIDNLLFSLPTLNNVFLKNSAESIWQLQPITPEFNTEEGRTFIIPSIGPSNSGSSNPNNPVYLSSQILGAFENGDNRSKIGNWIDTTIYQVSAGIYDTVMFPYKYKINSSPGVTTAAGLTEYFTVFRLAEQYLIRAEARAYLEDVSGSRADLLAIRGRAGLMDSTLSAYDKPSLLFAVLNERQVELFTEWGHRWFDLKRTGKVDEVMDIVTPLKGGLWEPKDKLYPILQNDVLGNPNITQNPGY